MSYERQAIEHALSLLESRLHKPGAVSFGTVANLHNFVRLHFATLEREQFGCLFLAPDQSMIAYETLFQGTLGECPVYSREIARRALILNACAVVLVHNHPSGNPGASPDDVQSTTRINASLDSVGVELVEHLIVCDMHVHSMREHEQLGNV
jgi:DNA repair protein RadC